MATMRFTDPRTGKTEMLPLEEVRKRKQELTAQGYVLDPAVNKWVKKGSKPIATTTPTPNVRETPAPKETGLIDNAKGLLRGLFGGPSKPVRAAPTTTPAPTAAPKKAAPTAPPKKAAAKSGVRGKITPSATPAAPVATPAPTPVAPEDPEKPVQPAIPAAPATLAPTEPAAPAAPAKPAEPLGSKVRGILGDVNAPKVGPESRETGSAKSTTTETTWTPEQQIALDQLQRDIVPQKVTAEDGSVQSVPTPIQEDAASDITRAAGLSDQIRQENSRRAIALKSALGAYRSETDLNRKRKMWDVIIQNLGLITSGAVGLSTGENLGGKFKKTDVVNEEEENRLAKTAHTESAEAINQSADNNILRMNNENESQNKILANARNDTRDTATTILGATPKGMKVSDSAGATTASGTAGAFGGQGPQTVTKPVGETASILYVPNVQNIGKARSAIERVSIITRNTAVVTGEKNGGIGHITGAIYDEAVKRAQAKNAGLMKGLDPNKPSTTQSMAIKQEMSRIINTLSSPPQVSGPTYQTWAAEFERLRQAGINIGYPKDYIQMLGKNPGGTPTGTSRAPAK